VPEVVAEVSVRVTADVLAPEASETEVEERLAVRPVIAVAASVNVAVAQLGELLFSTVTAKLVAVE